MPAIHMIHCLNPRLFAVTAVRSMVAAAALAGAAACAPSPAPKDGSTYTAARHRQLGSNIPQPDSVDTANNTMSNDQLNTEGNNQMQNSMRSAAGGGR